MNQYDINIINQTRNGKVFTCSSCNKIHLEYKNLNFTFDRGEFDFFHDYFQQLDPCKWEMLNKDSFYRRKIMIPIGHKNVTAMFHTQEVFELKALLNKDSNTGQKSPYISSKDFHLEIILN